MFFNQLSCLVLWGASPLFILMRLNLVFTRFCFEFYQTLRLSASSLSHLIFMSHVFILSNQRTSYQLNNLKILTHHVHEISLKTISEASGLSRNESENICAYLREL